MTNSARALRLAGIATFYDNSADQARIILLAKDGIVVWQPVSLPAWVRL